VHGYGPTFSFGHLTPVQVTPVRVALVKTPPVMSELAKFTPLKFARVKLVWLALVHCSAAFVRFASVKFVLFRFAPFRRVPTRFAPARFAPPRYALSRYAPVRFAPVKFALSRSALVRSAPVRFAPVRFAFLRKMSVLSQYAQFTFAPAGALQFPMPGLTEVDQPDQPDVPTAFDAFTLNLYEVPAVSPVTVTVPEPDWETVPVIPPDSDVAVYCVIGDPPLDAGAVKATVTEVDPVTVTAPIAGVPGANAGTTEPDSPDAAEVPTAFLAVTMNLYEVPVVNRVTRMLPEPD
jgi:hypothetical protein